MLWAVQIHLFLEKLPAWQAQFCPALELQTQVIWPTVSAVETMFSVTQQGRVLPRRQLSLYCRLSFSPSRLFKPHLLAGLCSKYVGHEIKHLASTYLDYHWLCQNYSQKELYISLQKCASVRYKIPLQKVKINYKYLSLRLFRLESKTAVARQLLYKCLIKSDMQCYLSGISCK